jgi:hypothetical protein
MSCTPTNKITSIVWNSHTWNYLNGGPIDFNYTHNGRMIEALVGDNEWATTIDFPDKGLSASVTLREVKQTIDMDGTASDMVATIVGRVGVSSIITLKSMVLVDVSASNRRGESGAVQLQFRHQSADGTTVPVS